MVASDNATSERTAFGSRLREAMANSTMAVADLAKAGVGSESGIRKWLYGQAEPGVFAVAKIAKLTGVKLLWLATGEGSMLDSAPIRPLTADVDHYAPTVVQETAHFVAKRFGAAEPKVEAERFIAYCDWLTQRTDEAPDLATAAPQIDFGLRRRRQRFTADDLDMLDDLNRAAEGDDLDFVKAFWNIVKDKEDNLKKFEKYIGNSKDFTDLYNFLKTVKK